MFGELFRRNFLPPKFLGFNVIKNTFPQVMYDGYFKAWWSVLNLITILKKTPPQVVLMLKKQTQEINIKTFQHDQTNTNKHVYQVWILLPDIPCG